MRWFRADLHIHSALSPCGSLAMSPRRIVEEAKKAGLSLIAICDHNAGENGVYVRRLARDSLTVLMGMEIQTSEEVEILALFPEEEPCLALQEELYALLPPIPNDPELFGDQVVVDENEEIVRTVDKLLLSPVPLSLEEVTRRVEARGGLVIPAHVDRVPGGLLGVLGLFPPGEWARGGNRAVDGGGGSQKALARASGTPPFPFLRCPLSRGDWPCLDGTLSSCPHVFGTFASHIGGRGAYNPARPPLKEVGWSA